MTEERRIYIKIRSWHVLKSWTRVPGVAVTVCGRRAYGSTVDDFGIDRTCETCFRLLEK